MSRVGLIRVSTRILPGFFKGSSMGFRGSSMGFRGPREVH